MAKKFIIILGIIYLFIFSLCYSYETIKISDFQLEKFINIGSKEISYNEKGNFIIPDLWEKQILEVDTSGNVIREVGGEGSGPGYFKRIFSITPSNDKYYIVDSYLWRLSILDKNLEFMDSFILRHPYQMCVLEFEESIITLGHNFTNPFDQVKNYYIGTIYTKDANGKYVYQKDIIPIKEFTNFTKIRSKHMKSGMPIPNICAIKYNGKAFILYDYLPEIIIYDPSTEEIDKIKINFPEYINPLKVNFKKITKYWKENPVFAESELVFSPEYFCYDDLHEIFIIQYKRPYQLRKNSENKHLYQTIIFNKEFEYQQSLFTNLRLTSVYQKNQRIFMLLYKEYDYTNLEEKPLDANYFEIHEVIDED